MNREFALSKKTIHQLFKKLNAAFEKKQVQAEIHLVGGAVMCLVFNARPSTLDLDGYFLPSQTVRKVAEKLAKEEGLPKNWLNDGVKGFFSEYGDFSLFLELSHLKIFTASAKYMLAMKCLSMRIGEEFFDLDDVAYLIRYLNIETMEEALGIIYQYYDKDQFPVKSMYALQGLLNR